jgi:preprotein translocase SecE subunit
MGLFKYINDTRGEMKHVAWPTQRQTYVYTALVIAVSIITSLYLGFFDFIFTKSLQGTIEALPGYTASQQIELATTSPSGSLPEGLEFTTTPIDGSSSGGAGVNTDITDTPIAE